MKREHQLQLFSTPPQPRRSRREDPALYYAIVLLRKRRNRIYRAGREHHLFNGERVTSAALLERAGA